MDRTVKFVLVTTLVCPVLFMIESHYRKSMHHGHEHHVVHAPVDTPVSYAPELTRYAQQQPTVHYPQQPAPATEQQQTQPLSAQPDLSVQQNESALPPQARPPLSAPSLSPSDGPEIAQASVGSANEIGETGAHELSPSSAQPAVSEQQTAARSEPNPPSSVPDSEPAPWGGPAVAEASNEGPRTYSLPPAGIASCQVTEQHKQYSLQRIRDTPVISSPYEHVAVHNIFPDDVYACILAHLPEKGVDYGAAIGVSGGNRNFISLFAENTFPELPKTFRTDLVPPSFRAFWDSFAHTYGSKEFKQAWVDMFMATMKFRFKDVPKVVQDMHFRLDLTRDRNGYAINPHTDALYKVITVLFYLPPDDELKDVGTLVYKPKNMKKVTEPKDKSGYFNGSPKDVKGNFAVTTHAPFVPNVVFAFAPCAWSWHGVNQIHGTNITRDSIQGFISFKVPGGKGKYFDRRKKVASKFPKGKCTGRGARG